MPNPLQPHGPDGRYVQGEPLSCMVGGCDREHAARGLCLMHWKRWRKHGDPLHAARPGGRPKELLDVLADKFTVGDDCWEWTAAKDPKGYGVVRHEGKTRRAHVVLRELLVGPIPEGLESDHLCQNRGCVRPAHIEPVTHAENLRRIARPTQED